MVKDESGKERVEGLDFDCPKCGYVGQFKFEDCPTCGHKSRTCPECGYRLKLVFPEALQQFEQELLITEAALSEPTLPTEPTIPIIGPESTTPSFDVSIPEAPPEPDLTLKKAKK